MDALWGLCWMCAGYGLLGLVITIASEVRRLRK